MGSAAERIAESVGFLMSDGFADLARSEPRHFTRRRKIPAGGAIAAVACRRGASMGLEMRRLAGDGLRFARATPAALSKARRKVSEGAVASLAPAYAESVYRGGRVLTLPSGLVPVAVDGSTAPVPTNAATLGAFGSAGCKQGARRQASMGVSCAFDPLNDMILSLETARGSFDERAFVTAHAERARRACGGRPIVLILDRGYPSLPLLADLAASGTLFVARCGAGFLAEEFGRCEEAGGDLDVEVELTGRRLHGHPPDVRDRLAGTRLALRLAVADVGGGPERIVSNLPRDAYGTAGALAGVYWWRWGVETCFRKLKCLLQLGSAWTSPDPAMLVQDVHVCAWLLNMAHDLAADATRAAAGGAAPGRRHEMRASVSWCVGALRQDLPALLRASPPWRLRLARRLAAEAAGHLEPVRPFRSAPRAGVRKGCGRRPSNTHKPAF